jgi:GDPmannose 4,6-dehydratase
VRFDERYLRPTEVDALVGSSDKARELLGWQPRTLTPDLARLMVDADIQALEAGGRPWVDKVAFA